MGSEDGTHDPVYRAAKERHGCKEQIFGLSGRGRGWDDGENSIETYAAPYVQQITSAGRPKVV